MSADLAPPRMSSLTRSISNAVSPKSSFFNIDPASATTVIRSGRRKSVSRFAFSKNSGRTENIPAVVAAEADHLFSSESGPSNLAELGQLRAAIASLHDQARAQRAERRRRSLESADYLRELLGGSTGSVPADGRTRHRRCHTIDHTAEASCSYSVRRKAVPALDSKLLEAASQRAAAATSEAPSLATLDYATFEEMFSKRNRAMQVDSSSSMPPALHSLPIQTLSREVVDEKARTSLGSRPSFFRNPKRKSSKKDLKATIGAPVTSSPLPEPSRQIHRARSQASMRPRAAVVERPQGRGISLAEALMMDDSDEDEDDENDELETPLHNVQSARAARRNTLHISPSAMRQTFTQEEAKATAGSVEEETFGSVQTPLTARPRTPCIDRATLIASSLTVPSFVSEMGVWSSSPLPNLKASFDDVGAPPPFLTPARMDETSSPELSFASTSSGNSSISDLDSSSESYEGEEEDVYSSPIE